ncbi:TonB-dependent receptor [Sphingomonas bacterium]|uniref:TonB-dependent receptor n=1 Tax=Sphingomonas bacterium TaxID=1895847 RepID=UPI00157586C7|nr:TonB-dependent receptor [Sphingomonas bacterium]
MNKGYRHQAARAALLVASSMASGALPARAQTSPAPTSPAPPSTPATPLPVADRQAIEDIIVTAQRREESVQRTPLAITAVTGDQLRAQNVRALEDVSRLAPNVAISASGYTAPTNAVPIVYIRGIGQQDPSLQTEPGVPIYVDGVYVARSAGGAIDLPDIARLEVLRGPQGTLFGKNTIGGAISLITVTPGVHPETQVELIGGNYALYQLRGFTNQKLSDQFGVSAAINYRHENGYGKRLGATGNELGRLGDQRNLSARVKARWTPTDRLTVDLSGDYTRYRNTATPGQTLIVPAGLLNLWNARIGNPAGTPITQAGAASGRYDNFSRNPQPANDDLGGASATIAYDLGGVTLKSITAYRKLTEFFSRDADSSAATYLEVDRRTHSHQFTQELQLGGKLLDDHVDYVLGGFYLHERGTEDNIGTIIPGLFTLRVGPEIERRQLLDQSTSNYAAFAQATGHLLPGLNLTLGGRYTSEHKRLIDFVAGPESGIVYVNNVRLAHTWTSFTPRAALDYQATRDVLVYASVSKGFKSGGFNGRPAALSALTQFDPEKVTSYELGFKSDLLDHHVRLNVAAFDAEYSNIQLQRNILINGVLVTDVNNVAKSRIQGAEGELTVVPATGLELGGSIGYAHNKYTTIQPGAVVTATSKIPYAPELTYSLNASYRTDLGSAGSLTPNVNFAYRSGSYVTPANTAVSYIPAYGLLAGRLTYAPQDGPWSASLFATNLTNKRYLTSAGDSTGIGIVYQLYGRPREFGGSINLRF